MNYWFNDCLRTVTYYACLKKCRDSQEERLLIWGTFIGNRGYGWQSHLCRHLPTLLLSFATTCPTQLPVNYYIQLPSAHRPVLTACRQHNAGTHPGGVFTVRPMHTHTPKSKSRRFFRKYQERKGIFRSHACTRPPRIQYSQPERVKIDYSWH